MASEKNFVDFILAQMAGAGEVTAKKMFGEWGLYADEKFFGVICDNNLFMKPTGSGRAFIGTNNVVEAPAYEGAKPSFLIGDKIDDHAWLCELVRLTVAELPYPKLKKTKK